MGTNLIINTDLPSGFFSHLAEIDTMCVFLNAEGFWFPKNNWLKETKAKRLQIQLELWSGDLDHNASLLDLLRNDVSQKTFKVETVECLVINKVKGDHRVRHPITFKNDAEVWEQIKDWFLPTVVWAVNQGSQGTQ